MDLRKLRPGRMQIAIAISILAHVGAFAYQAEQRRARSIQDTVPAMEVVLVNLSTKNPPKKAKLLSQNNVDGGGDRSKNNTRKSKKENIDKKKKGDGRERAIRKTDTFKDGQRRLAKRTNFTSDVKSSGKTEAVIDPHENDKQSGQPSLQEAIKARAYRFAQYVDSWKRKMEESGAINYPEQARQDGVTGSLRLTAVIRSDGSLASVTIDKSSGSLLLDEAAKKTVEQAAPFPPFPKEIARETDVIKISRVWSFSLEGGVQVTAPGGAPIPSLMKSGS